MYLMVSCLSAAVICLSLAACAIVRHPRFGTLQQGERLAGVERSNNYRDGKFQNQVSTPKFSEDVGMASVIWSLYFNKNARLVPDIPVPVVKTDLKALDLAKDTVVWLGHSSWFIQVAGKRILIDPVFSDYAAPFAFMNRAFDGTTIYAAEDMPEIDCLLISHDHWDHLDYFTGLALRSKVKQVICPLGVGAYFEYWDYPVDTIREGDWWEEIALGKDFSVHVLPARHYSGRLFKENKTLWAGFAIQAPGLRIFYSGDSGYGPHFADIGETFHGFDLVLLDCGQYDPRWAYIHIFERRIPVKRILPVFAVGFIICTLVSGLNKDGKASSPANEELSYNEAHGLAVSNMQVRITSQGHTATLQLYQTVAAKDFYDQLPLQLDLTNFRDAQWMFYPPEKLTVTDREAYHDGKKGELSYYAPWGDVFMLYKDFYAGDEMHRLGINVTGIEEIAKMSGKARIEKCEPKASAPPSAMKISVTANGNTTVFELNNSLAAKSLYAQLPMSIAVENYSNNEKIFYPPKKLDTADTPQADAHQAGTLAYYAPWGDVVMFYGRFGAAAGLYTLGHAVSGGGHIRGMSGMIRIEKSLNP